MNPLAGYLLAGALLATLTAGLVGYTAGRKDANDSWEAKGQAAQIAELERALADANASQVIAQDMRSAITIEVANIELQTENRIAVVRAGWDRPVCALPERVRETLHDAITAANSRL